MEKTGINWSMTLLEFVSVGFCIVVIFVVILVIYRLIRGFPPRR
jgi:hypothetical protein